MAQVLEQPLQAQEPLGRVQAESRALAELLEQRLGLELVWECSRVLQTVGAGLGVDWVVEADGCCQKPRCNHNEV